MEYTVYAENVSFIILQVIPTTLHKILQMCSKMLAIETFSDYKVCDATLEHNIHGRKGCVTYQDMN